MKKRYNAEKVVPYNDSEAKTKQVKTMFDSIAHSYDKLNITLSFGIDRLWRRKALASLKRFAPKSILDVATGTGDLAILAYKKLSPDKITGIDLSEGMLEIGRDKVKAENLQDKITLECQDCLNLDFEDNTFDAITVGFGVRNFENISKGYDEMYRVLKPGGVLMVLELSTPEKFPMNVLYNFYSSTIIPTIGKLVSNDTKAYSYLNQSIKARSESRRVGKEC